MPDTDGLELARRIKADARLADMELIMLTSTMQVNAAEISRGRRARMADEAGPEFRVLQPPGPADVHPRTRRSVTASAVPGSGCSTPDGPSRGRILVVEDNEVNQLVARATVSRLGYAVDVVSNGVEALAATSQARYAAVLMDCHMPVMDGFEATRDPAAGRHASAPAHHRHDCRRAGRRPGTVPRCRHGRLPRQAGGRRRPGSHAGPLGSGTEARLVPGPLPQPLAVTGGAPTAGRIPSCPGPGPACHPAGPRTGRRAGPAARGKWPRSGDGLPAHVAAVQAAVDDGDGPALAQAAHALKGAAANIGAAAVARICGGWKPWARDGTPDDAGPWSAALRPNCDRLDGTGRGAGGDL
jgi:CheY-like chemotaxis protein